MQGLIHVGKSVNQSSPLLLIVGLDDNSRECPKLVSWLIHSLTSPASEAASPTIPFTSPANFLTLRPTQRFLLHSPLSTFHRLTIHHCSASIALTTSIGTILVDKQAAFRLPARPSCLFTSSSPFKHSAKKDDRESSTFDMAKHAGQAKSLFPRKAQLAKLVKQAALAPDVNERKQQIPRSLKQAVKGPNYALEDPFTRDATLPIDLAGTLAKISVRLPIQETRKPKPLLPQKPFPFLRLPQELQDDIFEHYFDHPLTFHVKPVSERSKALTYTLPYQSEANWPKVKAGAWRRRRKLDYPRRIRSNEADIPTYTIPTGRAALLHVHPRIAQGAAKYFYRLHTFRFTCMRALQIFMDTIAPSSKEAIRNLEIDHYTAGCGWTEYRIWKAKYDNYYEKILWRVGCELIGLQTLKMNVRINDIPLDFGPHVIWREPFEALGDMNLSCVKIKVDTLLEEHKDAMEVESYLIEQELLGEQYRDGCDAVERRSNVPEKLLSVAKRSPIKILNLTMPGYPRRS